MRSCAVTCAACSVIRGHEQSRAVTRGHARGGPGAAQRALPRLRRLRSAALSLRGLGGGLEPARRPVPPRASAGRAGARRRASRQMKKAIPPRTMTAPMTMTNALLPDSELLPLVCALALVTGGVVEVAAVGVTPGATGETPPESGLVDPLGVTGTAGAVDAGALVEVSGETPPELAPCLAVVLAASAAPGAAASSASAVSRARARLIAPRRAAAPWPGW